MVVRAKAGEEKSRPEPAWWFRRKERAGWLWAVGGLPVASWPGVIWGREVMARWLRESGGWQCDSASVGGHMAVCSGPARGLLGVNTVAVRSALWLVDAKH